MELVYLWVEEYKNIHKQGFNFSGRYRCEYDGENLTIDKNKDYVHVFPNNINVTAIVGKNGSGKSSLIEALMLILFGRFYKKYFLLIENDAKYIEYIAPQKLPFLNFDFIGRTLPEYDNHLNLISGLKKPYASNQYIKNIISKTEEFYSGNMSYERSVLTKAVKVFAMKPDYFSKINKDFVFDRIEISINKLNTKSIKKELFDKDPMIQSPIDHSIEIIDSIYNNLIESKDNEILPNLSPLLIHNAFTALAKMFSFDAPKAEAFLKFIEKYQKRNILISDIIDDLTLLPFETSDQRNEIIMILKKVAMLSENNLMKLDFVDGVGFTKTINMKYDFQTIKKYIETFFYLIEGFSENFYEFQMIKIDFKSNMNKKISFFDLSDGEKRLLSQMIEVQYELLKKASRYLLLLDEPDNSLHPNWNKDFLSLLFKLIDKAEPIHFIVATHSPFILSDIPSQNIIFLDRDENGNCKVVDGLKDKKQTFGANIHTLLSDGFFMEDGLIGEIAKEKINQAIFYLNKKQLSEDELLYCEDIILIIGEPILKKQLQRMLDSKKIHYLAKDTKEEIEFLKHRIDLLSKRL